MDIREIRNFVLDKPIGDVLDRYPYIENFFNAIRLEVLDKNHTLSKIVNAVPDDYFKDYGLTKIKYIETFINFIDKMDKENLEEQKPLKSISIIGGKNKFGEKENLEVKINQGEIICIVGPTGSGKSRLLGDIECLAQGDTPTERQILIEDEIPSEEKRFNMENKLVAQLSQNMNFVMDLSVKEFIKMHAESRMVENIEGVVKEIINCANELAGEKFTEKVTVTQLSGGQSRALMIADTALLSSSPIILIDEIENAGIDRRKALEILVKKEKIILMSTHDPILALLGDKRIVIENGGIKEVIDASEEERKNLPFLQEVDKKLNDIRNLIRFGGKINFNLEDRFNRG